MDQKGGGLFGYTALYGGYSGGQAEYVRVPYANFGPRQVPEGFDDNEVLFLTDIFPTGYSGVDWAGVEGGETVAVFGCGPVGLMAQKAAWLRGAERVSGVDLQPFRLEMARKSAKSETIDLTKVDAIEAIRSLTNGRGADVCIDAVGMEADRTMMDKVAGALRMEGGTIKALSVAISAVRRGGIVSVLGVYGTNYNNFPLGQIFDKGIHMHFGQAPVQKYIDKLLEHLSRREVRLDDIITHELELDDAPHAYRIFNDKADNCVNVVMRP